MERKKWNNAYQNLLETLQSQLLIDLYQFIIDYTLANL